MKPTHMRKIYCLTAALAVLFPYSVWAEQPFLKPPKVVVDLGSDHAGSTRNFQGIPSIARSSQGRLWAVWYGGPGKGEDQTNYVIVVTSGDDGKTWTDGVLAIDPDGAAGPVRAFDPELWLDPTGKLWVFWAQDVGHSGNIAGVWCMTTEQPDSADAVWSEPRRLTDGIMMCKPTVLSTGEWILPASTWRRTDDSAKVVVSTDHGKTWAVRGGCNVPKGERAFDEHMIVEKKDGTLWLLARTRYGIGESFSTDGGKTWPELKPTKIAHPSARFFIRRLKSGNLLLVKHGPIDKPTGRSDLMAYVSEDDGNTWPHSLMLDKRKGVSYPDGVQAADGTIYIIYDRNRTTDREILLARFQEDDVRRGQLASENSALRLVVNAAGTAGKN